MGLLSSRHTSPSTPHSPRLSYSTSLKRNFSLRRSTKKGKPSAPDGLPQVKCITHNSVLLSWRPPLDPGFGNILAYTIEKFSENDKSWVVVTKTGQGLSFHVRDLQPGMQYLFRVRAESLYGLSRSSLTSQPIQTTHMNVMNQSESENSNVSSTTRNESMFTRNQPGAQDHTWRHSARSSQLYDSFAKRQSKQRMSLRTLSHNGVRPDVIMLPSTFYSTTNSRHGYVSLDHAQIAQKTRENGNTLENVHGDYTDSSITENKEIVYAVPRDIDVKLESRDSAIYSVPRDSAVKIESRDCSIYSEQKDIR